MIKAVLFDLDDTLYAESDYVKSGFSHCSKYISRLTGKDVNIIYEELFALFDEERTLVFNRYAKLNQLTESFANDCVDEYRGHSPSLTLSQEVVKTLSFMRSAGIQTGIVTDGTPARQHAKVASLGLNTLVDVVIVTDEIGGPYYRKPCPVGFELALQRLNVCAQNAAYVGDNLSKDFITPNRMGMLSVRYAGIRSYYSGLVAPRGGEANIEIRDLFELTRIVCNERDFLCNSD